MQRTRFTIAGTHPLLYEIRRHLIVNKRMQLVEPSGNPDFAVIGAAKTDAKPADLVKWLQDIESIDSSTPVLV